MELLYPNSFPALLCVCYFFSFGFKKFKSKLWKCVNHLLTYKKTQLFHLNHFCLGKASTFLSWSWFFLVIRKKIQVTNPIQTKMWCLGWSRPVLTAEKVINCSHLRFWIGQKTTCDHQEHAGELHMDLQQNWFSHFPTLAVLENGSNCEKNYSLMDKIHVADTFFRKFYIIDIKIYIIDIKFYIIDIILYYLCCWKFQTRLDEAWNNPGQWEVALDGFKVPPNPNNSGIPEGIFYLSASWNIKFFQRKEKVLLWIQCFIGRFLIF